MVHDTHDTHDTYSQDSWSHFWGKFLGRCGNTQIHLLHMMHMAHDTHDTHDAYSRDSWSHF